MGRYEQPLEEDWWKAALIPDGEQTASVIANATTWDRDDYNQLLQEMNRLTAAQRKLAKFAPTGGELTSDAFLSLFKAMPEVADVVGVRPDHLINRTVIEELHGMVEYKELHGYTAGDLVAAGFATVTLEPTLEELLDEERARQRQADDLQKKLAELMEALAAKARLDETLRQWLEAQDPTEGTGEDGEGGEAPVFPQEEERDAAGQQVTDLEALCAALAAALADGLTGDGPGIQAALQGAVAQAAAEARGFGPCDTWGIERGQLIRMSAAERIALAKKLNSPRMRRIAELFGSLKHLMWAMQAQKTTTAEHWVVDVELGNDLARVLPHDLLRMVDPDQEDLFIADFITGSLPQWRLEGNEKVGQGRIVFCEDGSSSMRGNAGASGGSREVWAKAVMLCLLHLARQQHREFSLIHFGSARDLWQKDFIVPADWNAGNIFEAAEIFFDSGTDFASPLRAAVASLQEEKDRTGKVTGDIVFATDGFCPVGPEFIEWFKGEQRSLGFQVYGICIGGDTRSEPLTTLADGKVCNVADLLGGGDIREVFKAL